MHRKNDHNYLAHFNILLKVHQSIITSEGPYCLCSLLFLLLADTHTQYRPMHDLTERGNKRRRKKGGGDTDSVNVGFWFGTLCWVQLCVGSSQGNAPGLTSRVFGLLGYVVTISEYITTS